VDVVAGLAGILPADAFFSTFRRGGTLNLECAGLLRQSTHADTASTIATANENPAMFSPLSWNFGLLNRLDARTAIQRLRPFIC
jgi:hypothetical protein